MPFFVGNDQIQAYGEERYQKGFQAGKQEGQQEGDRTATAQCWQMACELKGKFERELGQNPTGVCRSNFYWLLEELWDLMKTAVRRWKRAEQELDQYIHDHDDQAWEVLKYEVDLTRKEEADLCKQLMESQEQLSGSKQRCRELEGKIRSLEGVVASLQNTLDRANIQGK
jgi:hypothetical protein